MREEQINFLSEIKPILNVGSIEQENPDKQDESPHYTEVDELVARIEKLERQFQGQNNAVETVRQNKVKEQIISALKENKKLTANELGNLIGLSRTRSNEYLRRLAKEGVAEGIIIGRQKYYRLQGDR